MAAMQKLLAAAGILVAIGVVSGASYWAGKSSSSGSGPAGAAPSGARGAPPPGVVVEASRVTIVKLPQALNAIGSLRSDETVVVRPEVAGRIATIAFREGERVAEGQVLVRLDDSVQKADLDRAIEALENNPLHDELQLKRLKKRKLMLKDQIFMLQRQLVPDIPA